MIWAETEAKEGKPAKRIPIDADPENRGWPLQVADGNINFTGQTTGGMTPIVRYVPKAIGHHVTHFASCPNAKTHRRSR